MSFHLLKNNVSFFQQLTPYVCGIMELQKPFPYRQTLLLSEKLLPLYWCTIRYYGDYYSTIYNKNFYLYRTGIEDWRYFSGLEFTILIIIIIYFIN